MNYGDLIRDAVRITLRNHYLWFFSFFVGLGSGGGGGDIDEQSSAEIASVSTVALQQGVFDNALLIVGLVLVGLLILLIFFALYVVSQGGLTESVAAIYSGEERRFSSTWRAGARNFWRVLGQNLMFLGILLCLLLVVGVPVALLVAGAFATDSTSLRVIAVILAVLVAIALLIVVFVLLAIVRQFARRELVLRGRGVLASVASGYRLFRRNIGRGLLVWLIQLGLMLAAGIALLIALVIVGLLVFLPTILLAFAELTTAAIAAGVVAGLIVVPLLVVALAVLGTFNHSYWTLAYLRLTTEGGTTRP
ncbi:MAG TPA: hypothetical protein VHH10_14260 [Rubrobacteraceae bacterium]|nr:hypothetical protein [Rubrobacteraceae bacterium]